ncbi:MAG: HypC/HybG/HupF family hydrogenase formation chaperone [Candidatus Marinimicrobia bacterium]|jgi:hydrogenase expression/formation protein HypC|nr:HypC/HybG/HupF family hydrogenase formation chaperone [Candidatus Neomarinimicrobiota bacterium]MBT3632914.1 HypC/HybG/HupF family hydrogenase formation chaperone [Candidatus Neomarinimicrobiota bacterium]MBT3682024.1 HypC/HybG/HupF family hydrogenase formation chaperone [Candidatus Neomarinimicrobiota bacterium]MBT3758947.1 HypC/HybG/HupF family hydrogenase formation chaperone [Candidatus Neomarinimicrobiota bacterium]MBT3895154.1 HypC/HybG/HupF family hydrogenase formation chaperone [Candi
MCLAMPGKVIKVFEENGLKMANIDYSGTINKACIEYVPEITAGEYTIIHAGFAISVINEDEAMKSFEAWQELEKRINE